MSEKREEPIKDRFVEYLRRTEGLNCETKGQAVLTTGGRKNFDYLVQYDGRTLALEITARYDEEKSLAHNSQSITVWNYLCPLIKVENLGGCTWLKTPSSYPMSSTKLKNTLKEHAPKIAKVIEETSRALQVGEEKAVQTKLGQFVVGRLEGPPSLLPLSGRGWEWKLAEAHYQESLAFLNGRILAKNKQLDTQADRRILIIVDNAPFGKPQFREAVSDFFNGVRDEMSNIDEVFIEFSENLFEKAYDSRNK